MRNADIMHIWFCVAGGAGWSAFVLKWSLLGVMILLLIICIIAWNVFSNSQETDPRGLSKWPYIWTGKNWMHYSVDHVGIIVPLLSQNGLRSNLRASNFKKFSEGACPTPPSLACFSCLWMRICRSEIHVTPLLKILARGLPCIA